MSYVPAISQMSISAEQAYGSVSAISGFVAVSIAMMNSQRKTIDYYTSIIQKKIDIINALRDVKNHFGMDKGGENDKVDDKSNKATDVSSGAVRAYLEGKHYSKDVINTVLKILDPGQNSIGNNILITNIIELLLNNWHKVSTENSNAESVIDIDKTKKFLNDQGYNQEVIDLFVNNSIDFSDRGRAFLEAELNISKLLGGANLSSINELLDEVVNWTVGDNSSIPVDKFTQAAEKYGISKNEAKKLYANLEQLGSAANHSNIDILLVRNFKELLNNFEKFSENPIVGDQGFTISKDDLNQRVQDAVETLQSENQINLIKFQAAIRNFETTVNAASQTIATDKQISLQIGGRI